MRSTSMRRTSFDLSRRKPVMSTWTTEELIRIGRPTSSRSRSARAAYGAASAPTRNVRRRRSAVSQQPSQCSRLVGGEPLQDLLVDGYRERDQLVAERPPPLREVDPAETAVIRVEGTADESVP